MSSCESDGGGVREEGEVPDGRALGATRRTAACDLELDLRKFASRPGVTEAQLGELRACLLGVRRMAKNGFAPTRRQLLRELGMTDRAYLKFFETFTEMVRFCGLRLSAERCGAAARVRLVEHRGAIGEELAGKPATGGKLAGGVGMGESGVGAAQAARKESIFGEPMEGYPMVHAPVNEQGVVVLFALMAKELGFVIEVVRQGFPDCEAKRKGSDDKWRRVRIEFEYLTSRFNHDKEGCDLVVCWEDDMKGIGVEVMELKSEMERLKREGGKKKEALGTWH